MAPDDDAQHAEKGLRLVGVDAARGVALLGMMTVHVFRVAYPDSTAPDWMSQLVLGRSAAMFAVLAGVGLSLLTGGDQPAAHAHVAAHRRGITARAGVIGAVGLSLGMTGSELEIILVQYAVMFLLALPFITMRLNRLITWAASWTVLAPVMALSCHSLLVSMSGGMGLTTEPNWLSLLTPLALLSDLLLTGAYPVLQWFSYVLFGLVLGRVRLRSLRVEVLLVGVGTLMFLGSRLASSILLGPAGGRAALRDAAGSYPPDYPEVLDGFDGAAWWWLAVDEPHLGTTPALVDSMGTAAIILGVCLLVGRGRPRVLLPLAGAGAMTLTLYSAHIAVMALITPTNPSYDIVGLFWWQAGVAAVVGVAFRLARQRGPLEMLAYRAGNAARSMGVTTPPRPGRD
ncbi:heparan-alpha-glucosaminide N-acetyltransferase domain-containing protein [Citricoccus sp. CH26A]|uniref:heparan-alpha-glucosaminide N-acetyltransferase domain-containing protein n=1 Tax=Citricoccus TaxID=169133 RepID=UPI001ED94D20|nr:heparan-alpha-glucosaminide N-acetyltransferase domain-containing protein [Citricoccus sp. CH26A]